MSGCRFPEHHRGGSGGGFPWAVLVIVAGVVVVGTSAAFARVMHDLMVAVMFVVGAVTVGGLAGLGLVLRHHWRMHTWRPPVSSPPPVLHLDARLSRPDTAIGTTGPRAVEAPRRVVPGEVIASRRTPRAELGRKGGR